MTSLDPGHQFDDFSAVAAKAAAKQTGLLHPVTTYPICIGAGIGVINLILGLNPWLYLVAGGGVVAGTANAFLRITILKEKFAREFHQRNREALERQAKEKMHELKRLLERLNHERATKQMEYLERGFARFQEKLEHYIGRDKPEFEQYMGNAELMFLSALQNLRYVADNLLDMQTIDVEDSHTRIDELTEEHDRTGRDNIEEIAYQQRQIELADLTEQNSEDLIKEVEGTITTLAEVTRSLSDIKATQESLNHSVEQARRKFMHVAERNKKIFDKVAESWDQLQAKY